MTALPSIGGYGLSSAQRSLWTVHRYQPESPAYNIPVAFHIHGVLDTALLRLCLKLLYQRHESLRTQFREVDGEPRQFIEEMSLAVPVVPMSEEKARQRVAKECARVFNLETGPLFFAEILKVSDQHHILSLNMHHIVSDGRSVDILLDELGQLYTAKGDERGLRELSLQYVDYCHWQQRHVTTEAYRAAKRYWCAQLKTAPALLELPLDSPRPGRLPHRGDVAGFRLPENLRSAIKDLCHEQQCTLYMFLLAAFQVMLFRHTGQNDIVVGTPTDIRGVGDLEGLVGYFVNPIALRSTLVPSAPFLDLLSDVKRTALEGFENQQVAFADVVEGIQPERSPSYSPVFQVLFAMEEGLGQGLALPGVRCCPAEQPVQVAKFDLSLTMTDTSEGLAGAFEYSTELFARQTIERMARRFEVLLSGIAEAPVRRLIDLPIVGEAERRQLTVDFNPSDFSGEGLADRLVHELFEAQAAATPDRSAVICGGVSLTYRSLNERANAVALELIRQGVTPGDYVGVCMGRSEATVTALLGVLKSGAAYVPLDPAYPETRIAVIAEDAGLKFLVCDGENSQRAWPKDSRILIVADILSTDNLDSRPAKPGRLSSHNLSHIIYTSGSTGRPKGVMIEHRSVVAFLEWCHQTFDADDLARVLFSTSICFDLSVFELWAPLTVGGTVVVVQDALALCQADNATGDLTLINTVPTALRVLVDRNAIGDSVKVVNVAGEPLTKELVNHVFAHSTVQRLYNLYGPTEATTYSTYSAYVGKLSSEPTIGKPIWGTQVFVLGQHQELLPLGSTGELYIGGAGLARGYLNRPELTAERFVAYPLGPTGPERLYRTGDLVRWSSMGELHFVGRVDNQVKVRGYRIELGEIEMQLITHDRVDACVVLARQDNPGDKRLVAYVVPSDSGAPDGDYVSELRAHSKRRLPEYMVPSAFVVLERLPLAPNGKIDRKALPAPTAGAVVHETYVPPTTELEAALCGIWQTVLKVDKAGIRDDFFALGGNSLLAIHLVSLISKELRVDLPVSEILGNKTVEDLARVINWIGKKTSQALPLQKVGSDQEILISYPQSDAWGLAHRPGFETFFNMAFALRLRGNTDVSAIQRSIRSLVSRHDSLRMRFSPRNEQIYLVVTDSPEFVFSLEDLSDQTDERAQSLCDELLRKEATHVFDPEQGSLLRVTLVKVSAGHCVLVITMQHLISDGWSINIFKREFDLLYRSYTQGEQPTLSSLPVQYSDYAYWSRQWHQSAGYRQQIEYWREKLSSFTCDKEFPVDYGRCLNGIHEMGYIDFSLGKGVADHLSRYCIQNGLTQFTVLMAVFHLSLFQYSGLNKLMVSSPVAGRNRPELQGSIGLYVNMVNIISDISCDMRLGDFIHQMKRTVYDALANSEVQISAIYREKEFQPPDFPAIVFNQTDFPNDTEWQLGDLKVEPMAVPEVGQPCATALYLAFSKARSGMEGQVGYDVAMFREETVAGIVAGYQQILGAVLADPYKRIGQIVAWNRTEPAEGLEYSVT